MSDSQTEKSAPVGETAKQRNDRIFADYYRRVADWWRVGDKAAPWPVIGELLSDD